MVPRPRIPGTNRGVLVIVLTVVLGFGGTLAHRVAAQASKPAPAPQNATAPAKAAPAQAQSQTPAQNQAAKIPPDQLDSLVAPIALYPDPLLAQVLAASTYPLEIVQLHQ